MILTGCKASRPASYAGASVVLVSIDTLRADRLGAYGYTKGSTPVLDQLARESVMFAEAYSQAPLTLPAHASLFTGLGPPRHGVRDNMGFTLASTHDTLASRFKRGGWTTGGAVSAYVLRRQTGIAQGFDFYDDEIRLEGDLDVVGDVQRDGAVAVDSLARWVEAQGARRFFAFLHLYEPHSPYTPPERHRRLTDPYDGEVAYADELVGRFLDRLRRSNQLDGTIVAVVADHGEGLKDHGEQEHGIFLYREAVRVPFLLRLPGGAHGGTRLGGTVGLVDAAATLLDLVGLPGTGLDGATLASAITSNRLDSRSVYSETFYPRFHFGWSELHALTDGRHRYIRAPRPELYDVAADPGEQQNLLPGRSSLGKSMNAWIDRTLQGIAPRPGEVPPDVRERLQALGYVGSSPAPVDVSAASLPDPKDQIATFEQFRQALAARAQGHDSEAVERLQALVAARPAMLDAWETLGKTLVRMERNREAIDAFQKVLRLDPMKAETHVALAKLYGIEGRRDLAIVHADIAASRSPAEGNEVRAQLLMDEGKLVEAAEAAQRSLAIEPDRAMSQFLLGTIARLGGHCEDALVWFGRTERSLEREPATVIRTLYASKGDCLARLGRASEAEQEFLREIAKDPASREGRAGLALLYWSQGKDRAAREVIVGLAEAERPATVETYWTIVRTLRVLGDQRTAAAWSAQARARFPADKRFR